MRARGCWSGIDDDGCRSSVGIMTGNEMVHVLISAEGVLETWVAGLL